MTPTNKPGAMCRCGHEAAKHEGLARVCLSCGGGECVAFVELTNSNIHAQAKAAAWLADVMAKNGNAVEHPKHYNDHPSGVECIDIVEHMPFCIGNAIKYLWRAGIKSPTPLEDLEKAKWYVERQIRLLKRPPVTFTDEVRERVRSFLYRLGS